MYGHVGKLANEIKKGASSVEGVEVKVWQVCLNNLVSQLTTV
jgi:NAD(P)H dehydrogenase (quinone)